MQDARRGPLRGPVFAGFLTRRAGRIFPPRPLFSARFLGLMCARVIRTTSAGLYVLIFTRDGSTFASGTMRRRMSPFLRRIRGGHGGVLVLGIYIQIPCDSMSSFSDGAVRRILTPLPHDSCLATGDSQWHRRVVRPASTYPRSIPTSMGTCGVGRCKNGQ